MRLWRISNFADLAGRGALQFDGRWHTRGRPVVYLADHPSTALLEILVHAPRLTVPETFQLLEVDGPDGTEIAEPSLAEDWSRHVDLTRALGDRFLSERRAALFRIPSVVMPRATNYLLNPAHPDARHFSIRSVARYPFDSRLFEGDGD